MNNILIIWMQKGLQGKAILGAFFILLSAVLSAELQAQIIVTGVVRDSEFQTVIPGATVTEGLTENNTMTDASGKFHLKVPTHTTLTLVISRNGFETKEVSVITANKTIYIGEIALRSDHLNMLEIYKLSDRAVWDDPITCSNQDGNYLDALHGVVQFPNALQYVPGVYTSTMGSHYGELRLNIRGFGEEHISFNLNGVPINYPDSKSFTWSGRDGFLEHLSTLQVQKGTNNMLHYSPYTGGAVNMITEPAGQQAGGNVGFEYGAGNSMHSTVSIHSGLLNEKFAVSLSGSRITSDGIIDGTWTDGWAYYLSMTYAASDQHRFEMYAMGAPQRHGQAANMQHIAAYSSNFATELGVPQEIMEAIPRSERGRNYNQGLNDVDPAYTGKQYWNGRIHNRYAPKFLNENEHYSHSPIGQFNWYADWSDKISQQTTFYYFVLGEGNTGVSGDVNLDYSGPSAFIDYNSTIAENQVKTAAEGILNNSVRDQWSVGTISRLNFHFSDRFNSSLGFSLDNSNIQQYQEVRDLLGGSFFTFSGNEFDDPADYEKPLGAIIGYHHTSQMYRFGFSGGFEYTGRKLTAFTSGAYSMASLKYTNHLRRDPKNSGQQYTIQPEVAPGFQIKSGISYRILDDLLMYANFSNISREPASRLVPDYPERPATESPHNLSIRGFDAGIRYTHSPANGIAITVYDYLLVNNTLNQKFSDQLNNEYLLYISNIDQRHKGIELDADFQPVRFFGIEVNASLGNWVYADYATGTLVDISADNVTMTEYTFSNKNLKTGNAPQLQMGTILSLHPVTNSYIKAGFRFYGHHFSSWNPKASLTSEKQQVWEIPEYYLLDLHAGYTFPMDARYRIAISGHVFNLLDELYIPHAMNNGLLNTLPGDAEQHVNSAAAASVFIGLPRTFSIGINVSF